MTEAVILALIALIRTITGCITKIVFVKSVLNNNPTKVKYKYGDDCFEAEFDHEADE